MSMALGPTLPPETDTIIEGVLNSELPEVVTGRTGFASSDGLSIWYESISPEGPPKGTILLIMANGGNALDWPPKFVLAFVDASYQVIRYDHRGTGMSDWVDFDWGLDLARQDLVITSVAQPRVAGAHFVISDSGDVLPAPGARTATYGLRHPSVGARITALDRGNGPRREQRAKIRATFSARFHWESSPKSNHHAALHHRRADVGRQWLLLVVPGIMFSLVKALLDAWILLVEVHR
jgi:pimeloyl-ACP methyl ester carboxylesterase